jgi:hypothetical protein
MIRFTVPASGIISQLPLCASRDSMMTKPPLASRRTSADEKLARPSGVSTGRPASS